ncbi:MAG: hypothetical protein MJ067_02710 [Oscillospiraceae bacterium]|nr:hypothetical protein [Oscillospiraceae bacterium]
MAKKLVSILLVLVLLLGLFAGCGLTDKLDELRGRGSGKGRDKDEDDAPRLSKGYYSVLDDDDEIVAYLHSTGKKLTVYDADGEELMEESRFSWDEDEEAFVIDDAPAFTLEEGKKITTISIPKKSPLGIKKGDYTLEEIDEDELPEIDDGDDNTSVPSSGQTATPSSENAYNIGICTIMDHPLLNDAVDGFKAAVTKGLSEAGINADFDVKNGEGDYVKVADYINKFYDADDDLIFAVATPVLQSAAASTPSIPIVATAVSDFTMALGSELDDRGCTGINVTGVSDLAAPVVLAEMTYALDPDLDKILVIYTEGTTMRADEYCTYLEDMYGIECYWIKMKPGDDYEFVTTEYIAATLCDAVFVLYDYLYFDAYEEIEEACTAFDIPLLSDVENENVTAYALVDYYELGYRAGEIACRILLNGEKASEIPVEYGDFNSCVLYASYKKAAALGLPAPATFFNSD